MHNASTPSLPSPPSLNHPPSGGSCPVSGIDSAPPSSAPSTSTSLLSKLNPLNYMPTDLSQSRAAHQTIHLPTDRTLSSIPRGDTNQNWEYPSPQQMYNAMLRKGYTDTPQDAVESMVEVHNFLNEGAWAEIVEWERRFAGGLARGWQECRRGEDGTDHEANAESDRVPQPRLTKFMGRPNEMTPKASILQMVGWINPNYGGEPPFDRHDWYVQRPSPNGNGVREVRYVIDYYSGPPEPTGEPVFYLDVRPAIDRPGAALERAMRWGGDVWWKASGGPAREGRPPGPPEETTSTLVLSTPGNHYIDVRLKLSASCISVAADIASSIASPPVTNDDGKRVAERADESGGSDREFKLHYEDLQIGEAESTATAGEQGIEWAFAGTFSTTTTSPSTSSSPPPSLRTWLHNIDTNHSSGSFSDQGLLLPHPLFPDSDQLTLETGRMLNPTTGTVQAYEEVWRDWTILALDGEVEKGRVCLVLSLGMDRGGDGMIGAEPEKGENPGKEAKGMVIRLGQWCQGLLVTSSSATPSSSGPTTSTIDIERWRYGKPLSSARADERSEKETREEWQRFFKIGKRSLPCEWACRVQNESAMGADARRAGEVLENGDLTWRIEEMEMW